MPTLHDPTISQARKISGYALSILPSLMLVFSGIMKLIKGEFMVAAMDALHLLGLMTFIGLLEITCVILYWIPKTMNLGFFLLCAYCGGILTAELISANGQMLPIPGLPLTIFLFAGTFLRKPQLSGLGI